MSRVNRREIVPEDQIGIFHCIQRAFLRGFDHATQKNFDHRKVWVQNRLRQQTDVVQRDGGPGRPRWGAVRAARARLSYVVGELEK